MFNARSLIVALAFCLSVIRAEADWAPTLVEHLPEIGGWESTLTIYEDNAPTDDPDPSVVQQRLPEVAASRGPLDVQMTEEKFRKIPLYFYIEKSKQRMTVFANGEAIKRIPISTGREKMACPAAGKCYFATTPTGIFHPTWLSPNHKSNKWNGARMPNAVFFNGGIALHGTFEHEDELGRRASGGCVRQSVRESKHTFELVQKTLKTVGKEGVVIQVVD